MSRFSIPLLLLAVCAVPAAAAPAGDDRQVRAIAFDDLDLSSRAGVEVLDRRIDHAIRSVCGSIYKGSFPTRMRALRCRDEVRRSASAQREAAVARASRKTTDLASSR